jgi:hypothetical protein
VTDLPDIVLLGKRGTGKTTVAQWLQLAGDYGYLQFDSTYRLVASRIWSQPTQAQVHLLRDAVYAIDDHAWANCTLDAVKNMRSRVPGRRFVIDGCPTEGDYWTLTEAGFVGVRLEADLHVCMDRLWRAGRNPERTLLTEDSHDSNADYTINNDGDREQLAEHVRSVLQRERARV